MAKQVEHEATARVRRWLHLPHLREGLEDIIVAAVNAHSDLVAALEAVEPLVAKWREEAHTQDVYLENNMTGQLRRSADELDAALRPFRKERAG